MRMAPKAVAYTLAHQVEVCGVIGVREGVYSIRLRTTNQNAACKMSKRDVEDGYVFSGYTFHTHPSIAPPRFKGVDYEVPGYLASLRGVRMQEGKGRERFLGRFSDRQMLEMLRGHRL